MSLQKYRGVLLVGLGIALVLFYTTYVTARTYYNPSATLLIVILGAFISVGGLLASRHRGGGGALFLHPLVSKMRGGFPILFLLTILALAADVVLTLYAVSNFGVEVEANQVVSSLIRKGDLPAWLGQQFAPALITGILFALFRNIYVRTMVAFFTLGTLGYAVATVLNDVLVIYDLSALRA